MLISQLFSYIQGEENTIPDMEQKTSDSMMDNNHRTLQNSNAMVQTEDNVRYTYNIDQGNNGVSSQLGGWGAAPYGAEDPSLVEPSSGGGSGLSTWSVALMLSAFVALSVGCTIYSFCKQSQSQSRPQASSPQQSSTTEAGLSRKERKSRLLAYFEHSGHQMVSLDHMFLDHWIFFLSVGIIVVSQLVSYLALAGSKSGKSSHNEFRG